MDIVEIEKNEELRHVLWACYEYWKSETNGPEKDRTVCYKWVIGKYKEKFGNNMHFHQSKLRKLSNLGFLKPEDSAKGGKRQYYSIVEPGRVRDLLAKWELY